MIAFKRTHFYKSTKTFEEFKAKAKMSKKTMNGCE